MARDPVGGLSKTANVGKNGWKYDDCPRHGKQPHMEVIGWRCVKCQEEHAKKKERRRERVRRRGGES